jgi:hypothetical protein
MNSSYPSQGYPQNSQNVATNEIKAKRQVFGHIISVVSLIESIFFIFVIAINLQLQSPKFFLKIFLILAFVSASTFHLLAIFKSDYLKGKPSFLKLLPVLAPPLLFILSLTMSGIIIGAIKFLSYYYMYSTDDNAGYWRLIFKPWIHKRPESAAFQHPNQKIPRPVIQEQTFNPLPEYSNTQNPTNV